MNNKKVLSFTDKEWLHFILKAEKLIIEKDQELSKTPIKELLEKIKVIEPVYYKDYKKEVLLNETLTDELSWFAVYQGDDFIVEEDHRGLDVDPKDRGIFTSFMMGTTTIRFRERKWYIGSAFKLVTDDVEIIIENSEDWGNGREFIIDLGNRYIFVILGGISYEVTIYDIPFKEVRNCREKINNKKLFECVREKPQINIATSAAMELAKEYGMKIENPIEKLIKSGIRTQKDI